MPQKMPQIHAISFYAPHWELVFQGRLALRGYGVKTRQDDKYRHRGLVLCYTSLKSHMGPLRAYHFEEGEVPQGVVGCAQVVDLLELTNKEKNILFNGYNNASTGMRGRLGRPFPQNPIWPMDYGYFMQPVHRFTKPFVPPVQHMYGPIGNIPLYPEIERQLPKWARVLV